MVKLEVADGIRGAAARVALRIARSVVAVLKYMFGPVYAPFVSRRTWSILVDGLACCGLWSAGLSAFGAKDTGLTAALSLLAVGSLYYVLANGLTGRTIGRAIVGHRVISLADGGTPGVPRAALRLASVLSPLVAGQIPFLPGRAARFAGWSLRNRLSGTAVVEDGLARELPRLTPDQLRAVLVELARTPGPIVLPGRHG